MAKPRKKQESLANAESVKMARTHRWNPLRSFSPMMLTRVLDALEYGDLREFALLAEVVAERDDTLKSVKPKREKAISRRSWNVLKTEKSAAADKHAEVLEDFWNNVRAENAYDRNERGGMSRLIKQMMTSVSYRYAVHHIVWKPTAGGKLRATFEFVPLWFFENRTGHLRFLRDGIGIEGEEMNPREWMVTMGDGLMVACLIGYQAKRFSIQDWLAFSEKFSMPGTLGRTSAAKNSDAGKAMKAAVESFGQDWAAVIYGDDGNSKIELVQPNGNPSAMPMPALIERVDRKMAALYRGADLSSMSSKDGEGTGASLQSEEADILEADDCEVISETLQGVAREVIAWHFGRDVEPLAYIQIQPPVREDKKFVLEAGKALIDAGVRVSKKDYLDRLGFAEADDDEDAIGEVKAETPKSETLKKEADSNVGGWRTMEDGQKVYIPELRNPTERDGGADYRAEHVRQDKSDAKQFDPPKEEGGTTDGLAGFRKTITSKRAEIIAKVSAAKDNLEKKREELKRLREDVPVQPSFLKGSGGSARTEEQVYQDFVEYKEDYRKYVQDHNTLVGDIRKAKWEADQAGYEFVRLPSDMTAAAPLANKSRPGTANRRAGLEIYENIIHKDLVSTNRVKFANAVSRAQAAEGPGGVSWVYIGKDDSPSVVVHELVHGLERGETLTQASEFLKKRAKGEAAQSLRDLTGSKHLRRDEKAYKDDFEKLGGSHYTGKAYEGRDGKTRATEILTTGAQRLLKDPVEFMDNDPEFFDFVVKTLQRR